MKKISVTIHITQEELDAIWHQPTEEHLLQSILKDCIEEGIKQQIIYAQEVRNEILANPEPPSLLGFFNLAMMEARLETLNLMQKRIDVPSQRPLGFFEKTFRKTLELWY